MLQTIEPGQKFRDGEVELRGDFLIQFDLHQQADQIFGFMYEDAVLFGAFDDGLSDQSAPFGADLGGASVILAVSEGDGHLSLGGLVVAHDFSTTAAVNAMPA